MGRTIVVTGGSRGIGREICLRFAQDKDNIVICYVNNKGEAESVGREVMKLGALALVHQVDVANIDSVRALYSDIIKTFGRVDVLINCAGVACYKLLTEMTEEEKNAVISVNLMGTINMCQEFSRAMISAAKGNIINISSMWGITGGSAESVYSASKAGVIGFSKALAKELGLNGIRVNCVAPGTILTDMTKSLSKDALLNLSLETALGRLGKPKDISGVVHFLASDDASYITGQVISADGGMVI